MKTQAEREFVQRLIREAGEIVLRVGEIPEFVPTGRAAQYAEYAEGARYNVVRVGPGMSAVSLTIEGYADAMGAGLLTVTVKPGWATETTLELELAETTGASGNQARDMVMVAVRELWKLGRIKLTPAKGNTYALAVRL